MYFSMLFILYLEEGEACISLNAQKPSWRHCLRMQVGLLSLSFKALMPSSLKLVPSSFPEAVPTMAWH